MIYRVKREESEEGVRILAKTYPRCFFEQPEQRRPLKKNIIDDLIKDGAPMAPELITASVEWYQTHLGYQLCLLAGRKRVDLHGKEGNAVTEYEHRIAQKKALAIREKMKRDREATSAAAASTPPVRYGTALPTALPKFLKSIETSAPTMTTTSSKTPTIAPAAAPVIIPDLMPMYEAMLSASAAMSLPMHSPEMRRAIVQAVIGVIMKEAQAVRDKYDAT